VVSALNRIESLHLTHPTLIFYSKDYYAFLEEGEGSAISKAKAAVKPKPQPLEE